MSNLIYPKELAEYIDRSHYIPKQVKYLDDIKKYAKYIYLEACNDGFKIEDIIEVDDSIYYQIRLLESGRQAVIPYEEKFHYYELLTDKNDIEELDNIINTDIAYYGSEIKYWFFSHKINLRSKKYSKFKPLLTTSDMTISDRKMYIISADYNSEDDVYTSCYASIIRTRF